ncbi:MAG: hypothetical protein TREMPRED_004755 [Tremellales sp. Tagirdzhanova-0007]|nr:MAG: hypothetical protein TREMPRED_004755 [Tremellales sp. Tagirdzhanova-0007]
MAGTRASRSAAHSSPQSTTKSTRSTPTVKRSSSLRQSTTTPVSRKRAPASQKASTSRTKRVKDEKDELSPTGMTESESPSSSDADSEDAFDPLSSEEDEPVEDVEAAVESDLDSDLLDEEDSDRALKVKKRKSNGKGGGSAKKIKDGKVQVDGYEDEDEEDEDVELEEGQEIAGRIYPAPKTGHGQISHNTFNFLKNLQIPERNDREWFRAHEPAFRLAEKEWHAFVGVIQHTFHEADEDIPILPPKDVIHRIYRDVRFSSDKTPYKRSFSLSTSRGGRKGVWAAYHLAISPNGKSILACGVWQPGKNETQTIRHHLLTESQRFREAISHPDFVRLFGPAKPHAKGKRQNVFGHDDSLKVAPKGVDKAHKDIDLLKLRTVAVVHEFEDEEVLSEDFNEKVKEVVTVMTPFVHMLNDFIALPPGTTEVP